MAGRHLIATRIFLAFVMSCGVAGCVQQDQDGAADLEDRADEGVEASPRAADVTAVCVDVKDSFGEIMSTLPDPPSSSVIHDAERSRRELKRVLGAQVDEEDAHEYFDALGDMLRLARKTPESSGFTDLAVAYVALHDSLYRAYIAAVNLELPVGCQLASGEREAVEAKFLANATYACAPTHRKYLAAVAAREEAKGMREIIEVERRLMWLLAALVNKLEAARPPEGLASRRIDQVLSGFKRTLRMRLAFLRALERGGERSVNRARARLRVAEREATEAAVDVGLVFCDLRP